jgi:hypothetical protein
MRLHKTSVFTEECLCSIGNSDQGCQMVYFQTKNPNFGKFLRALELKMWVYFTTIWNIYSIWYNLWPFGIVCGDLVNFSHFGIFGRRKIWQPCLRSYIPRYNKKWCLASYRLLRWNRPRWPSTPGWWSPSGSGTPAHGGPWSFKSDKNFSKWVLYVEDLFTWKIELHSTKGTSVFFLIKIITTKQAPKRK